MAEALLTLALRSLVDSLDATAAAAPAAEVEALVDSMVTQWPFQVLELVVPAVGARLASFFATAGLHMTLFADYPDDEGDGTVRGEDARTAARTAAICARVRAPGHTAAHARVRALATQLGIVDAAIRRDEDAYRAARDAGTPPAALRTPLLDAFGADAPHLSHGCELELPLPAGHTLFLHRRTELFRAPRDEPACWLRALEPSAHAFERNWDAFSSGLLRGLDWSGLVAAGGSVLACAMRSVLGAPPRGAAEDASPAERELAEDLDEADRDAREFYFSPTDGHRSDARERGGAACGGARSPFSRSADIDLFCVGRDGQSAPTGEEALSAARRVLRCMRRNCRLPILALRTGSALTLTAGYPFRHVQVVLKTFACAADVLAAFDVDCCAFAWDGTRLLATPRALRATASRCNLVDTQRRSQTYESRLLKYARRGFGVGVGPPLLRPAAVDEAALDVHLATRPDKRPRVDGLLRLLVADRASSRAALRAAAAGGWPNARQAGQSALRPAAYLDHCNESAPWRYPAASEVPPAEPGAPRAPPPLAHRFTMEDTEGAADEATEAEVALGRVALGENLGELGHGLDGALPDGVRQAQLRERGAAAGGEAREISPREIEISPREINDEVLDSMSGALHRPVLYTAGVVPWHPGADAVRIHDELSDALQAGEHLAEWYDHEEAVPDGAQIPSAPRLVRGTAQWSLALQRANSAAPSENVLRFGWALEHVVLPDDVSAAAHCLSFFPRAAEGFSAGVHTAEEAGQPGAPAAERDAPAHGGRGATAADADAAAAALAAAETGAAAPAVSAAAPPPPRRLSLAVQLRAARGMPAPPAPRPTHGPDRPQRATAPWAAGKWVVGLTYCFLPNAHGERMSPWQNYRTVAHGTVSHWVRLASAQPLLRLEGLYEVPAPPVPDHPRRLGRLHQPHQRRRIALVQPVYFPESSRCAAPSQPGVLADTDDGTSANQAAATARAARAMLGGAHALSAAYVPSQDEVSALRAFAEWREARGHACAAAGPLLALELNADSPLGWLGVPNLLGSALVALFDDDPESGGTARSAEVGSAGARLSPRDALSESAELLPFECPRASRLGQFENRAIIVASDVPPSRQAAVHDAVATLRADPALRDHYDLEASPADPTELTDPGRDRQADRRPAALRLLSDDVERAPHERVIESWRAALSQPFHYTVPPEGSRLTVRLGAEQRLWGAFAAVPEHPRTPHGKGVRRAAAVVDGLPREVELDASACVAHIG